MAETKIPSPNKFGADVSKVVKEFPMPDTLTLAQIETLWKDLKQFSFLDTTNGELAWLKGTLGNKLYHIDPKVPIQRNALRRFGWTSWRKKTNVSDETWRNWRKIAERFTRAEARKIGLTKMIDIIREEAAANKTKATPKPPIKQAKVKNATLKVKQPIGTKDDPAPALTLTTDDDTDDVIPMSIADLADWWESILDELEPMSTLANDPGRFIDPKDTLGKLKCQSSMIATARSHIDNLEMVIAVTIADLQEYIDNPKGSPDKKKSFTIMIPPEEAAVIEKAKKEKEKKEKEKKEKAKAKAGWMNPDSPAAAKLRADSLAAQAKLDHEAEKAAHADQLEKAKA